MKLNILRIFLILMLFLTMGIIFGFSNQNGKQSSGISNSVSKSIIEIFNKDQQDKVKKKKTKRLVPIIRKLAHFSIYTLVGFLFMALFSTYKIEVKHRIIISLILGFIYACSDEIHQLFIQGRSGEVGDVLIDTLGVLLGIFICYGTCIIYKKRLLKKHNYDSI